MTEPTLSEPTATLRPAARPGHRRGADGSPASTSDPNAERPDFGGVMAPGDEPVSAQDADPGESDLFSDPHWDRAPVANRLTRVLLVAILVVAGFGGGVALEKAHGTTSSATGPAFPGGFSGAGRGAGALPGLGAAGAGPSSAAGSVPAAVPVVVGTVQAVDGTTLTVQNFAGATVTVLVPATATVTAPGLAPVSAGETVSVVGTQQPDGSVVASAVTARAAG